MARAKAPSPWELSTSRRGRRQGGGVGSKGERLQRCWVGGWEWAVSPTGLSAGQWSSVWGLTFQQGLRSGGCGGQSGWQQRLPGEPHWPYPALQSPGWSLSWRWGPGCENGCVLAHVNPQVPGLLSTVCLWPQGQKVPQGHRTVRPRNFPGGPVFKRPRCHCRGVGSIPGQGTKIPHPAYCLTRPKLKKKPNPQKI